MPTQVDGDAVPVPHFGAALTVDAFHALAERLKVGARRNMRGNRVMRQGNTKTLGACTRRGGGLTLRSKNNNNVRGATVGTSHWILGTEVLGARLWVRVWVRRVSSPCQGGERWERRRERDGRHG